jgi:hypothetical protein
MSPLLTSREMCPPRQADRPMSPSAVLAQQLPVDPRVVVEPVEVAEADHLLQVAKADLVPRQEHDVIVLAVSFGRAMSPSAI